ncbi:hypothetical protein [Streptomyces melanogenes]|uniref:hypothetical protein n=1 Tax=Streptomyces melanogenes TaxID=67326 RepID=UPI00167DCF2A|nr:hypothetical protein [Streptomyces melanogenes]GGP80829.1 hypothetical protein GCM10010278_69200 [Streptomyces melanogenes]
MTTPEPKTPIHRNTPMGKAVITLHQQLTELEERTGGWPGADVVDILGDWLEQFDFTAAQPAHAHIPPRPPDSVWLLRRWDSDEDRVLPFTDEGPALAEIARHVRANWTNLRSHEDAPPDPPADDRKAVELYYGPDCDRFPDEGYSLHRATIQGRRLGRLVPLTFTFPPPDVCERANRNAVFHPQTDENDLPCSEVDGILVFAYLNHKLGAVQVSIHLDTASDHLVRPDGTVPLRVSVEDTVVLDDSGTEGAPREAVLDQLLNAADASHRQAIHAAALAAGLLWNCPACHWDNPAAAACCEDPGPCRKPKPAAHDAAA